eukprot:CAMPEP_0119162164 /NCGR_PEP_ID=MMETSP1315-20130426/2091_1 /TAXON_ID=676789 /ORGANISM="Prasinoderma singularis, Strain RCC927" /LENGTH=52 /DNA_ID=CAMNT_0007155001 /DNA_START=18 /DNA_END=173 /DNA_ORIENTATION=+
MPLERPDARPRLRVPQPHRVVDAARRHQPPIGAEAHGLHHIAVPLEREERLT